MCAKKAKQNQSDRSKSQQQQQQSRSVLEMVPCFLLRHVLSFHCTVNNVTVARGGKYAAVCGGVAFAKEEHAKNVLSDWVSKHEYDENGPTIMHTKCVC